MHSRSLGLAVAFLISIVSIQAADWNLVWSDEFEVDGRPNPEHWNFEHGFVRNEEAQWYQPENAFCEDGMLVIEARRERLPNPNYKSSARDWKQKRSHAEYTSASLRTKGLHAWLYGRFEVRAKITAAEGLWPAIWFLGVEGRWPSCGEIDLMEYYDDSILANACWSSGQGRKPIWDTVKKPLSQLGENWDDRFHVWRMDWDAESIRLYVDNVLLNTIELSKAINLGDVAPRHPFQQPHYMLLNLAIGGTRGGDPSKTDFPTRYLIDYVRVYQQDTD
ncbi:MAG: glycoside hydrolase family 16 protein [Opitutaceae bacterium]